MAFRLAFMGTPDFALPALARLAPSRHEVARVYCQPPRPAGRGHKPRPSPVQRWAQAEGLAVATPTDLRDPAVQRDFAALDLDVAVVCAYGLILPRGILDAPRLGCLNIHASLLPRWRGAAPIQRALLAGDDETGITIMQMDEGLDTGDILLAQRLAIGEGMDAGTLHDQLADLGAHAILAALDRLEAGDLAPAPQATTQASYAPKLRREDGALDWGAPAAEIDRRVRALTPWPGAHFRHAGERVKLLAARPLPDPEAGTASAGTLLDAGQALVACGAGALKLERVQRPGRKPVSGPEFLRGARLGAGDRLG